MLILSARPPTWRSTSLTSPRRPGGASSQVCVHHPPQAATLLCCRTSVPATAQSCRLYYRRPALTPVDRVLPHLLESKDIQPADFLAVLTLLLETAVPSWVAAFDQKDSLYHLAMSGLQTSISLPPLPARDSASAVTLPLKQLLLTQLRGPAELSRQSYHLCFALLIESLWYIRHFQRRRFWKATYGGANWKKRPLLFIPVAQDLAPKRVKTVDSEHISATLTVWCL